MKLGLRFVTVDEVDQVLAEALDLKLSTPSDQISQPCVPSQRTERPLMRQ